MKKVLVKIVAGVAVIAVLAAGVTSSVLAFKSYKKVDKFVKSQEERVKKELEETEDVENVLIADQYQIVPTKAISDAYISGETDKLTEEEKETLDVAKEVLESIVNDSMSDYEKEKAIYEWIVENVKHDGDGAISANANEVCQPLGVLKKKHAVCAGYATTFRLLTNMIGLDCMIMHTQEKGHSWDIVKLDDGCWYITDCYFDVEGTKYGSFNMTKEQAARSHDWQGDLYPEANGTKYCYAIMNAETISTVEDIIDKLKEPFNKKEATYYSLVIPKGDEEKQNKISYVIAAIQERGWGMDDSSSDVNFFENGDDYVIEFTKSIYNENGESEELGEEYEKLDKAITEAFGEATSYDEEYYDGENYGDVTDDFSDEVNANDSDRSDATDDLSAIVDEFETEVETNN